MRTGQRRSATVIISRGLPGILLLFFGRWRAWGKPGEPRLLPLAQVAPADLHVPILGQLAPAQLPLGDALEPGPLKEGGRDAALRGGPLGQWTLEHAPRHPDDAAVLADLNRKLDGLPIRVPTGVLGKAKNIGGLLVCSDDVL